MNSNSNKPSGGTRGAAAIFSNRIVRRTGVALAVLGLLWAAERLDPTRAARDAEEDAVLAERRQAEAKVRELVPEAREATADTAKLTFSDLAFDVSPEQAKATVKTGYAPWLPPAVKALDGRRVRIEGYMLPTKLEDGKAKECLILANQMACCYGQSPRFCEFIVGRVKGDPAPVLQDRPLVFEGTLKVADVFEGGAWMSLYALELDAVGR
jgi:hypothetical protein